MPRTLFCAAHRKLQIVFVSTEVAPWSKVGGLGDVLGALPAALAARGHRVMTVAPLYEAYDGVADTGLEAPVLLPPCQPCACACPSCPACASAGAHCAAAPARAADGQEAEQGAAGVPAGGPAREDAAAQARWPCVRFHHVRCSAGVDRVFVGHPLYAASAGDIYGAGAGSYRQAGAGLDLRYSLLGQAALLAPLLLWASGWQPVTGLPPLRERRKRRRRAALHAYTGAASQAPAGAGQVGPGRDSGSAGAGSAGEPAAGQPTDRQQAAGVAHAGGARQVEEAAVGSSQPQPGGSRTAAPAASEPGGGEGDGQLTEAQLDGLGQVLFVGNDWPCAPLALHLQHCIRCGGQQAQAATDALPAATQPASTSEQQPACVTVGQSRPDPPASASPAAAGAASAADTLPPLEAGTPISECLPALSAVACSAALPARRQAGRPAASRAALAASSAAGAASATHCAGSDAAGACATHATQGPAAELSRCDKALADSAAVAAAPPADQPGLAAQLATASQPAGQQPRQAAAALPAGSWGRVGAPRLACWATARRLLARALASAKVAFCIHNLAYQGLFPQDVVGRLCLPASALASLLQRQPDAAGQQASHQSSAEGASQPVPALPTGTPGQQAAAGEGSTAGVSQRSSGGGHQPAAMVNWMQAALLESDQLLTVSPSYARDICEDAGGTGCGMQHILSARGVKGITNGLDTRGWNPATDLYLPPAARFTPATLEAGKAAAKAALQARYGLAARPDVPLVAVVGRLAQQKGVDAVLAAAPALLGRPLRHPRPPGVLTGDAGAAWTVAGAGQGDQAGRMQLVMVGSGETWMEHALRSLQAAWPGRAAGEAVFTEAAAHAALAGADYLLMPSRFEPCGLVALAAQAYAALPIATATGGLRDIVTPRVGYLMEPLGLADDAAHLRRAVASLQATLDQVLQEYGQPAFHARRRACMEVDVSWQKPAQLWEQALLDMAKEE